MGREIKRVPLDFKWPLNQVWVGYINPYGSVDCKACDRSGENDATRELSKKWYSFDECEWENLENGRRYNKKAWSNNIDDYDVKALVAAGRLMDFTHKFEPGVGWVEKIPPYIPSADEVNRWNRNGGLGGHDGLNRIVCIEAKAKRLGIYGLCEFCKGEGFIFQSEEIKKLHDAWNDVEPPSGIGFQLWETCSEGSPISPVFEDLDTLCAWAENGATTFGYQKTSKENWMKMLNEGSVYHAEGNNIFL